MTISAIDKLSQIIPNIQQLENARKDLLRKLEKIFVSNIMRYNMANIFTLYF